MNNPKFPLHLVKIASPCTAPWGAMSGDERIRFCGQCSQHVYNLSEMTQAEAEAIVAEREGKLCVRFYRRSDGTMMTKDCPIGWRALKQRIALVGGVMATIFVATFSLLTLGFFAASVRGNGKGGIRLVNPIERVWDLLFPQPFMGEPMPAHMLAPPPRDAVTMGAICLPQPVQIPPVEIDLRQPPKEAVPAREALPVEEAK